MAQRVDLSAIAQEKMVPQVYDLVNKWDKTPLYRSLALRQAAPGQKSIDFPVAEEPPDARDYTIGSGATLTPDNHEIAPKTLLLDKVSFRLALIEEFEALETDVEYQQSISKGFVTSAMRKFNAHALTILQAAASTSYTDPAQQSPETPSATPLDWTKPDEVVEECERLIGIMDEDMNESGLGDDGEPRFVLFGTDIENLFKQHGTGQNQDRTDLMPAWVRGSLNPILGMVPLAWRRAQLGYDTSSDGYSSIYTRIPIVVYEPHVALFGIQKAPDMKVYDESDYPGLKLRSFWKFGRAAFDKRKIRVGFLKVAGNIYGL